VERRRGGRRLPHARGFHTRTRPGPGPAEQGIPAP
jgi:hypothetical protein